MLNDLFPERDRPIRTVHAMQSRATIILTTRSPRSPLSLQLRGFQEGFGKDWDLEKFWEGNELEQTVITCHRHQHCHHNYHRTTVTVICGWGQKLEYSKITQ